MYNCRKVSTLFGVVLCITLLGCGGGGAGQTSSGNDATATSQSAPDPSAETLSTREATTSQGRLSYRGVNLSGGEYGYANGTYGYDYIYPNQTEVDYFMRAGMNVIRLPFLWERLQPVANAPLDSGELTRIDAFIAQTTAKGMYVILDPHNYAYYQGQMVGSSGAPDSLFADFWERLASQYRNNPFVIFGLMNEPIGPTAEQWAASANAAIAAIRASGASNPVLVPGTWWTGAQSWIASGNSVAMLTITDPFNNFMFEVHQYLDDDSSGTHETCVSPGIGAERVAAFTAWLHTNGRKGFLGEFAGADNDICKQAVDNLLTYMEQNSDVWAGWTWWTAGPWSGNYMFSIEPSDNVDKPLMAILDRHL